MRGEHSQATANQPTRRVIAAALVTMLLVSSSGCHGRAPLPQESPTAEIAAASAEPALPTGLPTDLPNTNPPMDPTIVAALSPQAEAGGTVGKPIDPHTLTSTELQFGRPPRLDPSVTYQPNVLVMEHGDTALRSMESNGIIWHFNAGAPQVDQIQPGKIIFATDRCVGRAAVVRRNGDDVAVVLEPVQITDLIQRGHFVYNQPLDLNSIVVAPAPDIPVQFKQDVIPSAPGASPTGAPSGASSGYLTQRFRLASVTYAVVTPEGEWKPFRVATYDARGHVTQRFLQPTVEHVALADPGAGSVPTGVPAPPAFIGEPPPMNVDLQGGMKAAPCLLGCGGIGVKLVYSRNGLNVLASAVFFLRNPNVNFDVDIGLSGIKTAAIYLNGAAGFSIRFEASADRAFAGNIHVVQPIPFDLSLPLNFAAPIGVHLIQNIALSTGFSARTSVLSAGVTFQACCSFGVGYMNGRWGRDYPQISLVWPMSGLSGISVGINSLVFGLSQTMLVGLGFAGFATGPYMSIAESMTALKQSSIAGGAIVGVDCKQATLNMQFNAGVGYTLPSALTSIVNVFLTLAQAQPLSSFGSLVKMPPTDILRYKGSLPKDCAG